MSSVRTPWARLPNPPTATSLFDKWANSSTPGGIEVRSVPWRPGVPMHRTPRSAIRENESMPGRSPTQVQAEACTRKWMHEASGCPHGRPLITGMSVNPSFLFSSEFSSWRDNKLPLCPSPLALNHVGSRALTSNHATGGGMPSSSRPKELGGSQTLRFPVPFSASVSTSVKWGQ